MNKNRMESLKSATILSADVLSEYQSFVDCVGELYFALDSITKRDNIKIDSKNKNDAVNYYLKTKEQCFDITENTQKLFEFYHIKATNTLIVYPLSLPISREQLQNLSKVITECDKKKLHQTFNNIFQWLEIKQEKIEGKIEELQSVWIGVDCDSFCDKVLFGVASLLEDIKKYSKNVITKYEEQNKQTIFQDIKQ